MPYGKDRLPGRRTDEDDGTSPFLPQRRRGQAFREGHLDIDEEEVGPHLPRHPCDLPGTSGVPHEQDVGAGLVQKGGKIPAPPRSAADDQRAQGVTMVQGLRSVHHEDNIR